MQIDYFVIASKESFMKSRHLFLSEVFLHIAADIIVHSTLLAFLHNVVVTYVQNLLVSAEIQKFWSFTTFRQILEFLSEQLFDGITEMHLWVVSSLHDPAIILAQLLFPSVETHNNGSDEMSLQIPDEF